MKLNPGLILSGCKVIEEIGSGGMGSVYKANDELLNRLVAIKLMNAEAKNELAQKRFAREAAALARFNHPGIVKIYSFGEFNSFPYYVMEFVDGRPLNSFITLSKKFASGEFNENDLLAMGYIKPDEDLPYFLRNPIKHLYHPEHIMHSCNLIADIADALTEAHDLSVIHRDLKPSNILIDSKGKVKLADFGLAKNINDADITSTNQILGTLKYMAPEQFMGSKVKITKQADIYSLGIIFYELLTNIHPVEAEDPATIIANISNGKIVSPRYYNREIPSDVTSIVLKCLEKNPSKRYKSTEELADDIRLSKGLNANIESKLGFLKKLKKLFQEQRTGAIQERKTQPALEEEKNSISPAMTEQAQKLYIEAYNDHFTKLDINVSEKIQNVLALNPFHIESYLLLIHYYQVYGANRRLITETYNRVVSLYTFASEKEKILLDIIKNVYIDKNEKLARQLSYQAYKIDSENRVIASYLVAAELALDNIKKSVDLFESFIKKWNDDITFKIGLAQTYASTGNIKKAISLFNTAIESSPDNIIIRIVKAQLLAELGDPINTVQDLEEILVRDPTNVVALILLANVYIQLKAWKVATNALRKIISLSKGESILPLNEIYYILYLISYENNEKNQADKYLKIAQNMSTITKIKSVDEFKDYVLSLNLEQLKSDNFNSENYDIVLNKIAKKQLFDKHSIQNYSARINALYYYDIDESFNCAHALIYPLYNESDAEIKSFYKTFNYLPLSPFIDSQGNIIKVNYSRATDNFFGNYHANFNLQEPIQPGCCEFFAGEFETTDNIFENEQECTFTTNHPPIHKTGLFTYVCAIPKNKNFSSSVEPSEIFETQTSKLLIFTVLLYKNQKFDIKIKLDKQ